MEEVTSDHETRLTTTEEHIQDMWSYLVRSEMQLKTSCIKIMYYFRTADDRCELDARVTVLEENGGGGNSFNSKTIDLSNMIEEMLSFFNYFLCKFLLNILQQYCLLLVPKPQNKDVMFFS